MSEETKETTTNPKIVKKSQSPSKITTKEDNNNNINIDNMQNIKNMTEQISNKSKTFLLSSKLTADFADEEELEGISFTFKEKESKIKLINKLLKFNCFYKIKYY